MDNWMPVRVVDRTDIDVGHQVRARVDVGTAHELHDLVDPDQAPAVDDLPHGVLGEDRTELLGLEEVERVCVAAWKLADLQPVERREWHTAEGNSNVVGRRPAPCSAAPDAASVRKRPLAFVCSQALWRRSPEPSVTAVGAPAGRLASRRGMLLVAALPAGTRPWLASAHPDRSGR
jgi:hypothetical protein